MFHLVPALIVLSLGGSPNLYAQQQSRLDAQAAAAAQWQRSLSPRRSGQARIAILDEKFPPGDGYPSDPAVLQEALAAAGYAVTRLNARELANPMILDRAEIDLLVIPSGDTFPAAAQPALVAYLQHRGAIVTMGGFAFDRPLVQFQGAWWTIESLPLGNSSSTVVFSEGITEWRTGTNRTKQPLVRRRHRPGLLARDRTVHSVARSVGRCRIAGRARETAF